MSTDYDTARRWRQAVNSEYQDEAMMLHLRMAGLWCTCLMKAISPIINMTGVDELIGSFNAKAEMSLA